MTPSPTRTAWMRPSRKVGAVPSSSERSVLRAHPACQYAIRAAPPLPLPDATASASLASHSSETARTLLEAGQGLEREPHRAHRRGELDGSRLGDHPAVGGDLHDRPLRPVHHPARGREAPRERVERLDPEPGAHQLRLALVVREGDLRQDVAACTLEEHDLAARDATHDVAQRPREVGGVDVHVVAGRDRMAAVVDRRRDDALVGTAELERGDLVVDRRVRVPTEDRRPVRRPLPAVDGELGVPDAPHRAGRLEPLARERAHRDDLVLDDVGEPPDPCVALGLGRPGALAAPGTADDGQVRVVPVDEDPGRVGARRLGDPVEEHGDLRLADADDVDTAEHDAEPVLLDRDRGCLEAPPAVPRRVVGLTDEADEREAQRRLERESRRADQERAAGHVAVSVAAREGCSSRSLGQRRHLAPGKPARGLVPGLGVREQALGEPHARRDEDPLDVGVEERRQADALVAVAGLVASVPVLARRGEVAEDLVRVARVQGGRARRALLHGDAVLGERLARPGDDDAVADADRVHRPAHLCRRRAVAQLRLDPVRPGRVVVRHLHAAPLTGGARLLEVVVVLPAQALDLREWGVRHERDRHGLARGGERGRFRGLLEAAAVARDRRHRAFLLRHDADLPAEPVGDRLERGEPEPRPHAPRLVLGVRERELRQHVPGGALEEDAFPARDGAHDVAHRAGEVRRVDVHVVARGDRVAPEPDERGDRGLVPAPRLEHRHLVVDQLVRVPPEDGAAVVAVRGALAAIDGQVDVGLTPDDAGGLEPLRREAADGDDPVVQDTGEGVDRRSDLVVDVAVHGAVRHAPRGSQVRVAQVEEDSVDVRAGRRGDAAEQRLDLRVDDPHDVDAAEHDARLASLEDEGAHLERQAVATRVPRLPDEPDHRQAERRLEGQGGSSGAKLGHGRLSSVSGLARASSSSASAWDAVATNALARGRTRRRSDRRGRRSRPCRARGTGRSHG